MCCSICSKLHSWNRYVYQTNTFQCVLATDGLKSLATFLYADGEIQWTTGDASDESGGLGGTGTPAHAGFSAGDGIRFALLPQSDTPEIMNVSTTSNIGVPGWHTGGAKCVREVRCCWEVYDLGYPQQNSWISGLLRWFLMMQFWGKNVATQVYVYRSATVATERLRKAAGKSCF